MTVTSYDEKKKLLLRKFGKMLHLITNKTTVADEGSNCKFHDLECHCDFRHLLLFFRLSLACL